MQFHDIGLEVRKNDAGELGLRVFVGGGLGRTPMIGKMIRDWLPEEDMLSYCEAILRVYNLYGRRDNKYKARIKILVHEEGLESIRDEVEAEFARQKAAPGGPLAAPNLAEVARIEAYFAPPVFADASNLSAFDAAMTGLQDAESRLGGPVVHPRALRSLRHAEASWAGVDDDRAAQCRALADRAG